MILDKNSEEYWDNILLKDGLGKLLIDEISDNVTLNNNNIINGSYNIDEISSDIKINYGSDFIDFRYNGLKIGILKFSIDNDLAFIEFLGTININNINEVDNDILDEYNSYLGMNYKNISIKGLGYFIYKIFFSFLRKKGIKKTISNDYSEKIISLTEKMLNQGLIKNYLRKGNTIIREL